MPRTPRVPRIHIDFEALTYEPAARPLPKGATPLHPIHTALLATYGQEGASISLPMPTNTAALLSQLRVTLRKHGHKVSVKSRQVGDKLLLWAEDARPRKARRKKATEPANMA